LRCFDDFFKKVVANRYFPQVRFLTKFSVIKEIVDLGPKTSVCGEIFEKIAEKTEEKQT
jgi:hypothetical protein